MSKDIFQKLEKGIAFDDGDLLSFSNFLKQSLISKYGEANFTRWLSSVKIEELSNYSVTISVASPFIKEWIKNHYLSYINEIVERYTSTKLSVSIVVSKQSTNNKQRFVVSENKEVDREYDEKFNKEGDLNDNFLGFETPLDPTLTFDNFIVGKSNKLASSAAKLIACQSNAANESNPLIIYSDVGDGKTHLLNAIAKEIKENSNKKLLFLSAERFMYQFIRSLRNKDMMSFKDKLRSSDILIIDDFQFICGKDATQQEFLSNFKEILNNNNQVIIAANKNPLTLQNIDEHVRSRFAGGLILAITKSDYKLRYNIVHTKAKLKSIELSDDIIDFIAKNFQSSNRELEGVLNRISAYSKIMNLSSLKLSDVMEMISDLIPSVKIFKKEISVETIKEEVAKHFLISASDLKSSDRTKTISEARHVAIYLSKKYSDLNLSTIGSKFFNRDHSTVINSIKKVQKMLECDDNKIVQIISTICEKIEK